VIKSARGRLKIFKLFTLTYRNEKRDVLEPGPGELAVEPAPALRSEDLTDLQGVADVPL
jgi:hypothetical protein